MNKPENVNNTSNRIKNIFPFFKASKIDRAKELAETVSIDELLRRTFYIIEDTNKVYMEYPLLKTYANPELYNTIINYIIQLISVCVEKHNNCDLHLNLKSFTITAANRHKELIRMCCEKLLQSDSPFQNEIKHIFLYNYPNIIPLLTTLFSTFVDDSASDKLILVK
jgi:hypothetical protein